MGETIQFPNRKGSEGGPEDPMLDARVGRLESDVREIRGDVRDIRDRVGKIEERLARIEGGFEAIHHRLNALPTVWTLSATLVGSVVAASGLALAIAKLLQP